MFDGFASSSCGRVRAGLPRGLACSGPASLRSAVEATEFRRTTFDGQPKDPVTTRTLTPEEVSRVADSFGRFELPDPGNACLYSPHHVLRCRYSDGRTHEIGICFSCGHIAVDPGRPLAVGMSYLDPIRRALQSVGVPVRDRGFYEQAIPE